MHTSRLIKQLASRQSMERTCQSSGSPLQLTFGEILPEKIQLGDGAGATYARPIQIKFVCFLGLNLALY
jgi:hypothetical protein